jgi:hypothetical protein
MTLTSSYSLQDAIEEALLKTGNGSTREVIRYLQVHHRRVLDDNSPAIESIGLGSMIRAFRKKPPKKDTYVRMQNLCLDFGLDPMDLDDEISVPADMTNILNSECDWPELEDATIEDLDKHLALRDAQEAAHQAKTQRYRLLRQALARIVPGRTDIPIRELRAIARKQRGSGAGKP